MATAAKNSEVEKAEEQQQPQEETKYVTFKDPNIDQRVITKKDFAKVNVDVEEDLVWSTENGFMVPLDKISEPAQAHLKRDKRFHFPKN